MASQLALDLKAEKTRLSKQCIRILNWLERGRVRNDDLARMVALKYTSRISELRQKGYDVRVVDRNHGTGVVWYALFVDGKEWTPWRS